MKARARFAAIVAILALLIGFLTEYFLTTGLSFDALLTLRHAVLGDRHQVSKSPVVVVNIDEATFHAPGFEGYPIALWGPQFAKVLDALDRAEVKVVGADLVFAATAETVPELRGRDRPLREVLQRLGTSQRIVLAETDVGGRILGPHRTFAMMVGYQKNIRKANVRVGSDGIVRSVPLWQPGGDGTQIPAFALTIAERAGLDPATLPGDLPFLPSNYADASVAPVYSMQGVYECANLNAIDALKAALAGKVVLLGAEIDVEDRKVTSGRAFSTGGESMALPCATATTPEAA